MLQGPSGEASVGLNAFIVKVSASVKVKIAHFSPLCPQEFTPSVQAYACAHPKFKQVFARNFANRQFCNMKAGEVSAGASVTVDLWLWDKSWSFQSDPPTPRPVFKC